MPPALLFEGSHQVRFLHRLPQLFNQNSNKPKSFRPTRLELFFSLLFKSGWPSGLRRCVQVAVSLEAWVRIPLLTSASLQCVGRHWTASLLQDVVHVRLSDALDQTPEQTHAERASQKRLLQSSWPVGQADRVA